MSFRAWKAFYYSSFVSSPITFPNSVKVFIYGDTNRYCYVLSYEIRLKVRSTRWAELHLLTRQDVFLLTTLKISCVLDRPFLEANDEDTDNIKANIKKRDEYELVIEDTFWVHFLIYSIISLPRYSTQEKYRRRLNSSAIEITWCK